MKKQIKKNHLLSYFTDIVLLIALILVSKHDYCDFKTTILDYDEKINQLSVITLTLVPCILTIISISLSISKEKIYGVTLNDLTSLRGGFYFTFFHMTLITCGIFGAYAFLYVFDLRIAIYCLEAISFIYSVIFAIQEIPILVHSRWILNKILNDNYLAINRTDSLFEIGSTKIFNNMITSIILTEGIKTAFNILNKQGRNEDDLLDYLLEMQNEYFWSAIQNVSFNNLYSSNVNLDVQIIDAIDRGYDNIAVFISKKSKDEFETKLSEKKYYHITRSIYSLHKLCNLLGVQNKESEKMISIISLSDIFLLPNKKRTLSISVIVCMLATTLNVGEVWFAKLLRDNNWYLYTIFNFERCSIGIFVSMLIHHLLTKKVLNEEETKRLENFIDQPAQGMNSDGLSWKKVMSESMRFGKSKNVAEGILRLLEYYESVHDSAFYFHGTRKRSIYSCDDNFTKQNIFHNWILMCFVSAYNNSLPPNLEPVFEKLSDDDKIILVHELSENWLNQGKIKSNIDLSFLKQYDSLFVDFYMLYNEDVMNQLVNFHDAYYHKQHDATAKTEVSLTNMKKKIIEKTQCAIEKTIFYDKTLPIEDETEEYFNFTISGTDYQELLDVYLEQLPIYFMKKINETLEKRFKINKECIFGSNDLKRIIDFAPEYNSCSYSFDRQLIKTNGELGKQLLDLGMTKILNLPQNLFWKKNAIKFNAYIDEKLSGIRKFTDDELEKLISDKYKPFDNGLYRFSAYENDVAHDFYVTKEQLMEYLRKSNFFVQIVFKSFVFTDKSLIKTI